MSECQHPASGAILRGGDNKLSIRILTGDCRDVLRTLEDASVNCCVTSPPYFGLRSYDETALRIDPSLPDEKRAWLLAELERRGIRAAR